MSHCEWSKTAVGRRTLFRAITCNKEDNILNGFDTGDALCKDAQNSQIISYKEDGVCFIANGERYVKWFDVKPDTNYFLTFSGRVNFPEWTDISFGIVDAQGLPLENKQTQRELDFFIYHYGVDQQLTVKGQDGGWYDRTYLFMSGSNQKMGFFVEGCEGSVILRSLEIFEAVKARNTDSCNEVLPFNWQEPLNDCNIEENYLSDLNAFKQAENYGIFINLNQDKVEYFSAEQGCYYLLWLPIPEDNIYTITYKDKVIESGGACYGFISQDKNGKRKWITQKNANKCHDYQSQSDAFCIPKNQKLAFAVFDGGGRVEFKDFKVFIFGNGREKQ